MSEADRWEDERNEDRPRPRDPRPRDRWGDYDDRGVYRRERSGAVTGVAVFSFVLGGIVLVLGLCMLMVVLVAMGDNRRGGILPPGADALLAVVILLFAALILWSVGILISGVGLIQRRQWGRILTLVLAVIGALAGIYFVISCVISLRQGPPQQFAGDARGGYVLGVVIMLLVGLMMIVHCILSYSLLLTSRVSEEFQA